ncbi:hypothetical protein [Thermococcus aciditolerans]|uniref:Uncharacterized protein n=1 Tax=Thermococcus aciditolerans TaxID=2598455 RepID=A0A5C0SLK1_9EURY|nr:hypothetical protein [Thermococcus aciditolerans]QEK14657.1 hypothetical protein FPV09_05615 [Thermococcus aciditolerans]
MKWKGLLAVLLGLLMVGVTAGSAIAASISNDSLVPVTPQNFGDEWELSLNIDYHVEELSSGDLYVTIYYDWSWVNTEIFNGPDDQIVILIPWARWNSQIRDWDGFYGEQKPIVTTAFGKAKIQDISFVPITVDGEDIQVARIVATVNDDVKLEGIWVSMTLKKEYRGMQVKTNLVYLHSWDTGSAVSTAGSIILPFALYSAPAGLNLAASVTWAAADIFLFQKFAGSWKKTKTETLTLYPNGNLPPCWNGICPTSAGGSAGGLD